MAFRLGNFSIDEILFGVGEQNDTLLFTLDQLSNASIEVSAESTDFVDKKGNPWKTVYTSKSATLNASSAMLHLNILGLASGTNPEYASTTAPITMPRVVQLKAGESIDITGYKEGTVKVIGLYNDGANAEKAATDEEVLAMISGNILTVPAAGTAEQDLPPTYVVIYEREKTEGVKITNFADKFPESYKLTLYFSYYSICDQTMRGGYLVAPNFQPDPNQTINLDRETQEIDFNGSLHVDYCSGAGEKVLYIIYLPNEEVKVVTATTEDSSSTDPDPLNP